MNLLDWDEPLALQNIVKLICFQVLENVGCARRPANLYAVDFGRGSQAIVYARSSSRNSCSASAERFRLWSG